MDYEISWLPPAARTVARQALVLGYDVAVERASTGSVYLTVCHECLPDGDRLIRIADHEANEARYIYRVNRRPDVDVEPGFQATAVRQLAKWIGRDPATASPYLKAAATRERKRAEAEKSARERRRRERELVTARMDAYRRRSAEAFRALDADTAQELVTRALASRNIGKPWRDKRKRFRRAMRKRGLPTHKDIPGDVTLSA